MAGSMQTQYATHRSTENALRAVHVIVERLKEAIVVFDFVADIDGDGLQSGDFAPKQVNLLFGLILKFVSSPRTHRRAITPHSACSDWVDAFRVGPKFRLKMSRNCSGSQFRRRSGFCNGLGLAWVWQDDMKTF